MAWPWGRPSWLVRRSARWPPSPSCCTRSRMRSETSPSSSSQAAPKERWLKHLLKIQWCHDRSTDQYLLILDSISPSPSSSSFPSGHFSPAADSAWGCGRDDLLAVGAGRGHGSDHLDPPIHCRRLRLHRHGDGPPRTAGGPLQFRPVCDGDSGFALWSRHDGGDSRVRVRRRSEGGREMAVLPGLMLGRGGLSFYRPAPFWHKGPGLKGLGVFSRWTPLICAPNFHPLCLWRRWISVPSLRWLMRPSCCEAKPCPLNFTRLFRPAPVGGQRAKFKCSFCHNTPHHHHQLPFPSPPLLCLMLEMTFPIMFLRAENVFLSVVSCSVSCLSLLNGNILTFHKINQ